jgi:DNA-binding transcriptional LysR family regulator
MLNVDALIAFAAVVDAGSFSAAAERLGQTPSGVSRTISRLEAQLGMTLMQRTTRRLDLTEEGEWLLGRSRKVLADLEDTEAELAARRSQPSGLVRLNAATPVLDHLVAPLVPAFLDAYPLVRLELTSGETVIDLIEERADLAIRIGPLADSTLNARRLGASRLRLLASPAYLQRHGVPGAAGQLDRQPPARLQRAGVAQYLAAGARRRRRPGGRAGAAGVKRRDLAPPGLVRRRHRLPVGFSHARRPRRRHAGAGARSGHAALVAAGMGGVLPAGRAGAAGGRAGRFPCAAAGRDHPRRLKRLPRKKRLINCRVFGSIESRRPFIHLKKNQEKP